MKELHDDINRENFKFVVKMVHVRTSKSKDLWCNKQNPKKMNQLGKKILESPIKPLTSISFKEVIPIQFPKNQAIPSHLDGEQMKGKDNRTVLNVLS